MSETRSIQDASARNVEPRPAERDGATEAPLALDRGVSRRGFLKGMAVGAAAAVPADGVLGKSLAAAQAGGAAPEGLGPEAVPITLRVNGRELQTKVEPRVTLLDALRDHTQLGKVEHLDLTGSKRVCDRSSCGACTVILDGRAVYACTVLAVAAQGREIRTVEGLAKGEQLDPVQEAFVHCDGLMCGFCTPGFVVAARALLDENPAATKQEVQRGLDGNICRCGTQPRALEAVAKAAPKMKGRR
jgi:xanthine dehydrogenase YagT iron-sulfur-binding subunit